MHMVFTLATSGPQGEVYTEVGGPSRFTTDTFPTNFKDASLSIRCRGELVSHESQLVVLIQGSVDGITSGWLLTGSPFDVSKGWTEQTVTLAPDPSLWTPMGVRHDRGDMYGIKPLDEVLSNVDINIMLVLFPLDVAPMGPIDGDPHLLRPERDYPVWRHRLPEGYVTLDSVEISFDG